MSENYIQEKLFSNLKKRFSLVRKEVPVLSRSADIVYLNDAGMFALNTFTKQDPKTVIEVAREYLENVPKYFKESDLDWVKEQYLGVMARYHAEVSKRTGFILTEYVRFNRLGTPEDREEDIRRVEYGDIREVAGNYLKRGSELLVTMGK